MKKYFAIIFLGFFLLLISATPTFAVTALTQRFMGQPCPPDGNSLCASGDCEESDILENGVALWFCDCDFDNDCEAQGGLGAGYECIDGDTGTDAHGVDYCQKDGEAPKYFLTEALIAQGRQELTGRGGDKAGALITGLVEDAKRETVDLIPPQINVPLPGLPAWTKQTIKGGESVSIPYMADYLIAIYKYSLVILSIVAVVALMIGGILYMTSGALPGNVAKAKDIMKGSVSGLLLLVSSYLMLNLINPDLVNLESFKLETITGEDLSKVVNDKWTPDEKCPRANRKTMADTTHDDLFKQFAACLKIDWRVLKVMAFKESGLDTNVVNCKSGFTGLFQTKTENCRGNVRNLTTNSEWLKLCDDVRNPVINTATGVGLMQTTMKFIQDNCSTASLEDKLAMLYMGHNSGPGSVQTATRSGCTKELLSTGFNIFWANHGKPEEGPSRFKYAYEVAKLMISQGVSSYTVNTTTSCPTSGPAPAFTPVAPVDASQFAVDEIKCGAAYSGKKVIAIGDSNTEFSPAYADYIRTSCTDMTTTKKGYSGKSAEYIYEQTIKSVNYKTSGYDSIIVYAGVNDINNAQTSLAKIYTKAKADGLRVIGVTITPWKDYGNYGRIPSAQQKTEAVNTWIRANADVVVDVYAYFTDPANADYLNPAIRRDNIHLNDIGQKALAKKIVDAAFR